jgi:hypothetical protein
MGGGEAVVGGAVRYQAGDGGLGGEEMGEEMREPGLPASSSSPAGRVTAGSRIIQYISTKFG